MSKASALKSHRVTVTRNATRGASVSMAPVPMAVRMMPLVLPQIQIYPFVSMAAAVNAKPMTNASELAPAMFSSTSVLNRLSAVTAVNVSAIGFASAVNVKTHRIVERTALIVLQVSFALTQGNAYATHQVLANQMPIAPCSDMFV